MIVLFENISAHNIACIRCISVYFPRRDIYSQRRTTKMTIAFCWIFPVLLLFLPLAKLWGEFGLECGTKNCVILKTKDGKTLAGFLGIFGFFLPLITLIVCNIAIYIRVKVKYLFYDFINKLLRIIIQFLEKCHIMHDFFFRK